MLALIYTIIFFIPHAFADAVEMAARATGPSAFSAHDNSATLWTVGIICFVLLTIMVVTLWPQSREGGIYERQRKFARVGDLFYKMNVHRCSLDETAVLLRSYQSLSDKDLPDLDLQMTLVGISFGGATLLSMDSLQKGELLVMGMHTLPDYPALQQKILAKVIWSKHQKDTKQSYYLCGVKFMLSESVGQTENLRLYLNYLMDDAIS